VRHLSQGEGCRGAPAPLELRGAVSRPLRALFGALGVVLLAPGYAWLTHQSWVSQTILPGFGSVGRALSELLREPELWTDLEYSFLRVTAGFLGAALLAVPLGILAGSFRLASSLLEPLCEFLRYIPVPALIPLVMMRRACERMLEVEGGVWGELTDSARALQQFAAFHSLSEGK
jgi:NitT/TauT family transport system permease protein